MFAVNKNPGEAMTLTLSGFSGTSVQHVALTAPSFDTCNTASAQPVAPRELPIPAEGPLELAPPHGTCSASASADRQNAARTHQAKTIRTRSS